MTEKKQETQDISRRKYLKYVAAGVVAVAAVGGGAYYYSTMPPTPAPTATATPTMTATATATETGTTFTGPNQPPLYFDIWLALPDIVKMNMDNFNAQNNETGQVSVVSGDYTSVVETKLISKSKIDMVFGTPVQAVRWYKAGWLNSVDEGPHYSDIVKDIYPWVVDLMEQPQGGHLGWPYFVGGDVLHTNDKMLGQMLGRTPEASDYPKTWDDVLNQCREAKQKGLSNQPFLPEWYAWLGGLPSYIQVQCYSEGEFLFDKNFDPTFDVNTPFADVLTNWKAFVDEGLAPTSEFATTEAEHIAAFCTGKYLYSVQRDYDCYSFNDPTKSKMAGYSHIVYPMPGRTHDAAALIGGLFLISNNKFFDRDAWQSFRHFRLIEHFAWKDKNGNYAAKNYQNVFPVWMGYPSMNNDPATRALWVSKGWMSADDFDNNTKMIEGTKVPPVYKGCIWFQEWLIGSGGVNDLVPQVMSGKIKVDECVTTLRALAVDLKNKYS